MGRVNARDVKAGMVLASDIHSRQGQLLLPAGSVVEDKHCRIFKIWGVEAVDVQSDPHDPDGKDEADAQTSLLEIDPQAFQQADEFLSPWFLHAGLEEEAMQEVFRHCLLQTARYCASHGSPPACKTGVPANGNNKPPRPKVVTRLDISKILKQNAPLASFPDIYKRITEVLFLPNSSARHVAEVIGSDTALTARLLRLVNSPLYGFPSEVDSISRAVALLGSNELCTLVLGITAVTRFRDIPQDVYDMRAFWHHATACAVLARLLAGYKTGLSVERFFVAGLLHDVGLLVLLLSAPQLQGNIMAHAAAHSLCLEQVEQDVLGFDHGAVSGALLEKWSFPESLTHAVRQHHFPTKSLPTLEPAITHVAESLATAYCLCEGDCAMVQPLADTAWRSLELPAGVLGTVLEQARPSIQELRNVLVS